MPQCHVYEGYPRPLVLRLGMDNFNSYYPASFKRARASALQEEGVVTLDMDLNDVKGLTTILQKHKITHILALAAQAGVRYAAKDPHSYVKSNIEGFVNLLEVARTMDPCPASSTPPRALCTVWTPRCHFRSQTRSISQPASTRRRRSPTR